MPPAHDPGVAGNRLPSVEIAVEVAHRDDPLGLCSCGWSGDGEGRKRRERVADDPLEAGLQNAPRHGRSVAPPTRNGNAVTCS